MDAAAIGYIGTELPGRDQRRQRGVDVREHPCPRGAAHGADQDVAEAAGRQHTPKVAFVAPPQDYLASSGKQISAAEIDLNVRALSMGKLHHAMMGTAAVAISTAAAIPGTLVNLAAGGGDRNSVTFGHPSGTLKVGAAASRKGGESGRSTSRWSSRAAVRGC